MTALATLPDGELERFRARLIGEGFHGDFESHIGAREVASTDNSIYRVLPAAIVYPRNANDVRRIVSAAHATAGSVWLCPRGGNTGTNGQSLSSGVIVDFARYMNRILSIDVDERGGIVKVEPGVVLDQLNASLAEHGLFFPPMVSTANRATIGGMVATDASGKGSRRYGKTSDYIEKLDLVLSDGSTWTAEPMSLGQAEQIATRGDLVGKIHREALRVACENADEIARVFPVMNRGLTGYNLQQLYRSDLDRFSLGSLLAGSEGTLAMTTAACLRVVPLPTEKALAVVRYDSFDGGLRDVARLLDADPVAIEILDDKVLGVAQSDIVWDRIKEVLGDDPDNRTRAISFVEFSGDAGEIASGLARLDQLMVRPADEQIDVRIVRERSAISALWSLREKSVGLLAKLGGGRQGMPFVEDTAVPPERLADFVAAFREILDRRGLNYGMFGHADVGCLHVRPFLDMKDPHQAALVRPISDEVAALTKQHGGLLWGEHGRGFRGEYSPFFFGPKLYAELRRIKGAFDPANLLNPGKIAGPDTAAVIDKIDEVPFRGTFDAEIADELRQEFDRSVACNGNGACFNWDARDAMCPSYKATRDRAQSPKGRAALLRTWARLAGTGGSSPALREELAQIEAATAASLSTCLSCKACTTLCPVSVDIPTMKSRFLERYHATRPRAVRHRLLPLLEPAIVVGRTVPGLANLVLDSRFARWAIGHSLGFVDLPRFAPARGIARVKIAHPTTLAQLSGEERLRTVVLIEDTFTSSFDGAVVEAAVDVLEKLGRIVFRMPARANGKALHVAGLRTTFARIARSRIAELRAFDETGVQLVGLDQAISVMFEQEYREFCGGDYRVAGLDEVIAESLTARDPVKRGCSGPSYQLFIHCTEGALRPGAARNWQDVFAHHGSDLRVARSGCCGMAGMFGHEAEHQDISAKLFDLSWKDQLGGDPIEDLATGFSCRSQVKRFAGRRLRHPVEAVRDLLVG